MSKEKKSKFQRLFSGKYYTCKNEYTSIIFSKIHSCHTKELGYHCYECNNENCLDRHVQYHSCGNRHCPFCGTLKKDEWVENRIADLLPTPYYHVVFTVPHVWNAIMMQSPNELYKILFDASKKTLLQFSADPKYLGATPGITSVLHTWGQKMDYHVHLHCVVTGGGLKSEEWIAAKRSNTNFLFPIKAMKKVYKAIFLRLVREGKQEIKASDESIEKALKLSGYKNWKVYAKAPFGGPEQVLKYLGRYTHKTAITHYRIKEIKDNTVSFEYKDYADNNNKKLLTLSVQEFLRRFEMHILPKRFVRIRHYGILTNRGKTTRINTIRKSLELEELPARIEIPISVRLLEKIGVDITKCKKCDTGKYELVLTKRFGKVTYSKARDVPLVA